MSGREEGGEGGQVGGAGPPARVLLLDFVFALDGRGREGGYKQGSDRLPVVF